MKLILIFTQFCSTDFISLYYWNHGNYTNFKRIHWNKVQLSISYTKVIMLVTKTSILLCYLLSWFCIRVDQGLCSWDGTVNAFWYKTIGQPICLTAFGLVNPFRLTIFCLTTIWSNKHLGWQPFGLKHFSLLWALYWSNANILSNSLLVYLTNIWSNSLLVKHTFGLTQTAFWSKQIFGLTARLV